MTRVDTKFLCSYINTSLMISWTDTYITLLIGTIQTCEYSYSSFILVSLCHIRSCFVILDFRYIITITIKCAGTEILVANSNNNK